MSDINNGGWETIHTNRKSRAQKRAAKKAQSEQVDPRTQRFLDVHSDFVQDEPIPIKLKKVTPPNGPISNKEKAKANLPKPKAKDKSKNNENSMSKREMMEKAIANIKLQDIQATLKNYSTEDANSLIMSLSAIANLFNMKIAGNVKELVNSNKSFDYPAKLFDTSVVEELNKHFCICTSRVMNSFHWLVVDKIIPLSLGRQDEFTSFGHLLLLQLWILYQKEISIDNLSKLAFRDPFGKANTSVLMYLTQVWTFSLVGYLDAGQGLLVWRYLLLRKVNIKPLTQFATSYLKTLLSRCNSKTKITENLLSGDDYELLCRAADSDFANDRISKKNFIESLPIYLNIAIQNGPKNAKIILFRDLLFSLESLPAKNIPEALEMLHTLLSQDSKLFETWKDYYPRTISDSNLLVSHISTSTKVDQKAFRKTLIHFQKVDSNQSAVQQVLNQKMSIKGTIFRYMILLLFLGLIFGYYDISRSGSLARSRTGRFLQDAGILRNIQIMLVKARPYTEVVSVYYKKHLSFVDPYLKSSITTIDKYLDLFVVKTEAYTREWRKNAIPFVNYLAKKTWQFLNPVVNNLFNIFVNLITWLEKNVFTGELAIENLVASATTIYRKFLIQYNQAVNWAWDQASVLIN